MPKPPVNQSGSTPVAHPVSAPATSLVKGIFLMVASAASFAVMNLFSRLAGDLPALQKAYIRNLVIALAAGLVYARYVHTEGREDLGRRARIDLVLRASFGLLGLIANFYAVDHLPLSDATILAKLSPFFAIIFSYFLLAEKIHKIQALCLALAFGGALLVVRPSFSNPNIWAYLVGFAGGMLAGLAYTYIRILTTHGVSRHLVVFYFGAFSSVVLLPVMVFNYVPMTGRQSLYLFLMGLCGVAGQYCMTWAYAAAPARTISIFDYSQVVFAALLSSLILQEFPSLPSILGYTVIFAASLIMFIANFRAAKDFGAE